MENGNQISNAEQVCADIENESEQFDLFINTMVLLIEKYGKLVLRDLDCVA